MRRNAKSWSDNSPIAPEGEQRRWSRHSAKTLGESDIETILNSVGVQYVPPNLDQTELVYDLNSVWNWYQSHQRVKSKSRQTAIREYARKVANAANALSEILDHSNEAANYFRRSVSVGAQFPLNDFRIRLQHLGRLAISTKEAFSDPHPALKLYDLKLYDSGPQDPKLRLSSGEFFFGQMLPRTFEKHFKRKAGQSRPSSGGGEPDGPYIRFAEAVSAAFGKKAARGSIGRAMTKASKVGFFLR